MGVDVLRALERAGYECFVPLERKSCFDIAARSNKQVLFIKTLSNIDSLREEQANDLMALANSLGATALLVGERSKVYDLEDGLVYERYGLQCVTTSTLERVLGGVMPDKEFNKGRVVAVDTPENLTHQLKGAAALYVQVGGTHDAAGALSAVPGVRQVRRADQHEEFSGYEIEAEPNRDVRTDVAKAVVDAGWGLLELRPMRLSLEEIFLQLTTEDQEQIAAAATGAPAQEAQHG